jgi:DNA-binding transcriptional MerR regulator
LKRKVANGHRSAPVAAARHRTVTVGRRRLGASLTFSSTVRLGYNSGVTTSLDPNAAVADRLDAGGAEASGDRLLRIQEVSDLVGLTARSIRYYEEVGLMKPAARSEGDYRLYDADDVARLEFIKGLRDDAGFSLAEIGQLLEDETARARIGARIRETRDPAERRMLLLEGIDRIDRQVTTLRGKIERLQAMIETAGDRRRHLEGHLAELEPGAGPRALRPTSSPRPPR